MLVVLCCKDIVRDSDICALFRAKDSGFGILACRYSDDGDAVAA